jgi:hypothetical protein
MLPARGCRSNRFRQPVAKLICHLDTFLGLNAVRALSIIGLLLVFSSNVCVIVHDVQAVNRFVEEGKVAGQSGPANSTVLDTDYIGYVLLPPLIHASLTAKAVVAPFQINKRVCFGQCLIAS